MRETVDTVVIGAGVVGLSASRALVQSGRDVIVLEKNAAIGAETSSRNSEVIHAGIYYTPGSLKSHLCVRGREALYRYCAEKGVEHRRCGKIIVAVAEDQEVQLERLLATAQANGVNDLRRLDRETLASMEPAVVGSAGLLSPSTGIVDSHALMLALRGDLEEAGGQVALRAEIVAGRVERDAVRLDVSVDGEPLELAAHTVVNAAGLHATSVARALRALPDTSIPKIHYAKGNYFVLQGKSPFEHLVYPLPEEGGLGVHATIDLAGRTRFGPDVEWSDDIDYTLDASRAKTFYAAIRRYWPELPDGSLAPGYVGVRPKLSGPGEPAADFAVVATGTPGRARVVHLFGIESPGLTASLALGDYVRQQCSAG